MYTNVSDSFLNKVAQPSRHFAARFYDGTTLLDLDVKSIVVTTGTCGGSNLAVGCAFAGYIEVVTRLTDVQLEGKELKLELGLLLDDEYEYIPFGYWTVQKPTINNDMMSFTAVDRVASKFNDDYTTSLTYPATIASVLSELATATGVAINCSLQTTLQLQAKIEDTTQRGALAEIANVLLGCAWCDRNGEIHITAYGNSTTDVDVDYDYVKQQPQMDESETTIGGVKVYTVSGQTDTYITAGSGHMLETSEALMTQTMLNTVVSNATTTYSGGSVVFMGNPLIDPSDTVEFTNLDDNTYAVPCMEIVQSFDGGLLTTVTAPGSFESTESTIYQGAITREMERQAKATAEAMETAETAQATAEAAASSASNANTLATSKGKIFFQSSAPSSGMQTNDMWMDTDGGNSLYQYNGSSWVLKQLGQGSIAAGSITAVELNVSNFTAGTGNVLNMTAGILTSSDWDFDYDTPGTIYSRAGMRISLTDKYIRTPNFAVVNGNLYARNGTFSGSVTTGAGNIGGWNINDYQIVYYDDVVPGTASTQYGVFVRAKEENAAADANTYHFCVYHRAYSGSTYGNWTIDYGVKHDGSLIASKGTIGPWTLDGNSIYRGGGYNSSTANSMYFGSSGLSVMDAFRVTPAGEVFVYGTDLHIRNSSTTSSKLIFEWPDGSMKAQMSFGTGGAAILSNDVLTIRAESTDNVDYHGIGISSNYDVSIGGRKVILETNTEVGGTLKTSGTIDVYNNTATSYAVGVQNSVGKVQLYMSSGGSMGLYDGTNSRWILYENTSGEIISPRVYSNTGSGSTVVVDSNGKVCRTSSSKRFKHDIKPLTEWKSILNIPVVSFKYNEGYVSKNDQRYDVSVPGFIAEDVDRYYPLAADKNKGTVEDWNLRYIVPPMLAVEQDHEKRIAELEHELSILKGERR